MLERLVIVAVASLTCISIAAADDVLDGQAVFKNCAPCHEIGPTAHNRVGPILKGLDGRRAGTVAGYPYSPATRYSGIVWTEFEFKDYVKNPKAKVPGTKMPFTGLTNQRDIDNLWSFLKQYQSDGAMVPLTAETRPQPVRSN